ncbi:DUF1837 domain-containing protein, partial [Candidatus Poribacteria bacterium]|nr:DUF1837 domain-containing protein [Candidatus Poribacteria bacterium]
FKYWCKANRIDNKKKHYWTYTEKKNGRVKISDELTKTILSHYDQLENIANDTKRLGYERAAEILREKMPQGKQGRSGDLGEILATELVEEETGFHVPVRRLRYKDCREMALRGDDFIGVEYNHKGKRFQLLKGEAKSNKNLNKTTVEKARTALERNSGRCTPDSLLFIANRLLESNCPQEKELGRKIRDEVGIKSLNRDQTSHMLFTMSGNSPPKSLKKNLDETVAIRDQYVVNIHIKDHQEFIKSMYEKAQKLSEY